MKKILPLLLVCASLLSCKKKNDSPPQPAINIEGFQMYDYSGNFISHYGPPDTDWHFTNSLSAEEMKLFDFSTGISLENTVAVPIPEQLFSYPNPCYGSVYFYLKATDSVVLKILITDEHLNVLTKNAFRIGGNFSLFQVELNEADFPVKSERRVYFSVSAKDHPDYQVGYGDIKICNIAGLTNFNLCFD